MYPMLNHKITKMLSVDERVKFFRGVQKYLAGAVIVGLSVAVVFLARHIITIQRDFDEERRAYMEYFQRKSEELQQELNKTRQSNNQVLQKTEQQNEVLKKTN